MANGFLSKYFPAPKFLDPPYIGLSFSDLSIKAIMFERGSSKSHLKSFIAPLEKGAIVSGIIINEAEVVKKLSIIKDNFDSIFVNFTIPDELVYVFTSTVPVEAKKDITESIAFTLEENVPIPISDAVFDFTPVSVYQKDDDFNADVAVVASSKKEVERYLEIIRKSGLEPISCVHESQAIAHSVIPNDSVGLSCIVHTRDNRVGIYLVKNDVVIFATLRTILDGNYEKQFIDEYDKFLEYQSKYDSGDGKTIQKVYTCGEFDLAKQSVMAITGSNSNIKNAILSNVWVNVFSIDKHIPSIPYETSLSFAGSIGAALYK